MTDGQLQIIHPRAPKALLREQEPTRLDDVHRHAQAGAKPDQAGGVLGDIGLVKGEAHGACFLRVLTTIIVRYFADIMENISH